jgi:prolipoprotein diacylglyceryltransferase
VHPTQLYDFVTGMVLFAALLCGSANAGRFDGQVMVSWLLLYPVARSLNELFRGDEDRKFVTEIVVEPLNRLLGLEPGAVTFLSTSQFLSIGTMAVGLGLYLRLRNRPRALFSPPPADAN